MQLTFQVVTRIKQEALARADRGEPLSFRFSESSLTVTVTPGGQNQALPPGEGAKEFVVRRKDTHNGTAALVKEVTPFLLSEETYPKEVWRKRYDALVGLKDIKKHVLTALRSLFSPEFVRQWSQKYNCEAQAVFLLWERNSDAIKASRAAMTDSARDLPESVGRSTQWLAQRVAIRGKSQVLE